MRVTITVPAAEEIEAALRYTAQHYPASLESFKRVLMAGLMRLAQWPEGGPRVSERPGVRKVVLVRYPYKIFYVIEHSTVQILSVRHDSRY